MTEIEKIIKPETTLEREIIVDPSFIEGAIWGMPRNGHPEGKVLYHIGHVLKNIDMYTSIENRTHLRLIAIIHDTFKHKVDRSKPKIGDNNHGVIARNFAEKYIQDNDILTIIELHDYAYYLWRTANKNQEWDIARQGADQFIKKLGKLINLYMEFYLCDNSTGNKTNDDFHWFQKIVQNYNLIH